MQLSPKTAVQTEIQDYAPDRSQVQVGWSLPPVHSTPLSAGFMFSRRRLVFDNVSGPKRRRVVVVVGGWW